MKALNTPLSSAFRHLTVVLTAVCLIIGFNDAFSQTSGKITGKVINKSTREPIPIASVVIEGTFLGATTSLDGGYVIINVPPSDNIIVNFSCLNFRPVQVTGIKVSAGQTIEIDVELQPTVEELPPVIVIGEPPKIEIDKTNKGTRFDTEKLSNLGVSDVTSLVKAAPGFKIDVEGKMHIRGSRSGDVAVIFEGVDLRDPLVDTQIRFNISADAVDEINVLSGGFNAEYGRVMGGVIQIMTPEGRSDRYTGRIDYSTDRLIDTYSFNTDRAELTLGGPVPYSKNFLGRPVTFFLTASGYLTNTYVGFSFDRPTTDMLGVGLNIPERQYNDYQTSLKLAYNVTDTKKLAWYLTSAYSQWDIYPSGEGGISGNYGYNYKYNLDNRPWAFNRRFSSTLTFTNQLSSKTFYEVKFITFSTRSKVQPRGKNPGEFTMLDEIEDDVATVFDRNSNGVIDRDEYIDADGNGFMDGFIDANGNGIFDGGGEGYEDLNINGRWDRGEDWVDLNGNGVYDFAEPWVDVVNPLTGENNIGVWDSWDPYTDLNGNGRWDPAEPLLREHDWNNNGHWDGERFQDANYNARYDAWEPWEDLNGNFYWDPGEPFTDTNGNGVFDYSEGYDDKNFNGTINRRDLARSTQGGGFEDAREPYIDGDFFWDTGEPFIDEPDPITGEYNGRWDPGEIWFDLPSSASAQTGQGFFYSGGQPVLNGKYDGPNYLFDEYELFTRPADWSYHTDRSRPIVYTFDEKLQGRDWPADLFAYIPGKSTWINRTLHDKEIPRFDMPNSQYDEGKEWFMDYNNNGIWDAADGFLNPGTWDPTAFWQDRTSTEYTMKFDIQSQVSKHHEMKSGLELKYRDLSMQAIQRPDLPYSGEAQLPEGSPWPERGGIRDFYDYRPWEGAAYIQDKMEFEGLIVNAGLRTDFIIHDPKIVDEFRARTLRDEPGAIVAQRGTWRLSPRLGISHPITEVSKLYFNYGHFYQAPQFQYFYRSATSNFNVNTVIGNPNLEYEKTIQYELGVNTQVSEDLIVDISGYYKDQYDMISTQDERWKNLTIDRYANIDYGRMRGFELSLEKRPSNHYAFTFNYDFSFAYGKSSDQHAAVETRLRNVPYNYDEHPLAWDETHKLNAYMTINYGKGQFPRMWGMVLPDNWMLTLQWEFGSGLPYTPSTYTTGIENSNLILPNSARYPWRERTTLKFEKYYEIKSARKNQLTVGFTINNLFNRRNVAAVYSETGSPTDATHPLNPNYNPSRPRAEYEANPRNYEPGRQIVFRVGVTL